MARRLLAALGLLLACGGAAAQPSTAPGYTIYAAGDIADCRYANSRAHALATAALVEQGLAATSHAAVLLLGDNVYDHGSEQEYTDCYGPSWGRFKARTYPSPGNHEYHLPGATGYFGYFGPAAGRGYYAFTLGSWRLISLDSNITEAAKAQQLAWLAEELAANQSRCTLAYWHHPLYSSGGHPPNAIMRAEWQLLHRADADLVLSGHDHEYERFAPQDAEGRVDGRGMRQFVVGTGGAQLSPFIYFRDNSEWRDANRHGVLKLRLEENGYRWEFLEASYDGFPNGPAPDRGAAHCH